MKARKILLVAALLFASVGVTTAQDTEEPQYLFDMKNIKLSGFGCVISDYSMVDNNFAISSGGGGALLFNYNYFVGFYGLNLVTDIPRENIFSRFHDPISNPLAPIYVNLQLSFENSGLWFGYINNHKKLIHWGANMKVGQGLIALYDKTKKYDKTDYLFKDNVFVASPEVEVEVNLLRWFKVNVGVGYRFVAGVGNETYYNVNGDIVPFYKSSQFNSPYANVKFLFGCFDKRSKARQEISK
jgi:hypothetical protein